MLMEMRKLDIDRDRILAPAAINALINKYKISIGPALPFLHRRFRDPRFVGSTNYEQLVQFLEMRRLDRQENETNLVEQSRDYYNGGAMTQSQARKISRPIERKTSTLRAKLVCIFHKI